MGNFYTNKKPNRNYALCKCSSTCWDYSQLLLYVGAVNNCSGNEIDQKIKARRKSLHFKVMIYVTRSLFLIYNLTINDNNSLTWLFEKNVIRAVLKNTYSSIKIVILRA